MFGYESALVTIGNKFLPSWIAFDKLGLIDRVSFSIMFCMKKKMKIENKNGLNILKVRIRVY